MASAADLFNDRDDPFGRQPVDAIIVKAPGSTSDQIGVSIPSFASDDMLMVPWMPRGATLPQVGQRCLIVFTADGSAWCPAWWPGT